MSAEETVQLSPKEEKVKELIDDALPQYREFSHLKINRGVLKGELLEIDNPSSRDVVKQIFILCGNELKKRSELNSKFDLNSIPENSLWQLFKKLVVTARKEELKQVKIIRRKGKYDISQLRGTYYGKLMLKDLNEDLGKRWMLKKEEYQSVRMTANKLGLKFPEEIMPTTTEQFFEEDV